MPKITSFDLYTRTGIVTTEARKTLYWEGSSKKDFKEFPIPMQKRKKSKSGIATPRPDVELIEKRLKAVLARYKANRRA